MMTFFLPGAAGSANFWKPVADRLPSMGARHFFSWPGLGNEPADPKIQSVDDLIAMVLDALKAPVDLVAQSMGGYIAMKVALAAPHLIRRLVLTATSAGVPMSDLGAINWRSNYRRNFPAAGEWIAEQTDDLTSRLGEVTIPCLLLWGDADPISPVGVGQRLRELLPDAALHVIAGADHDLAVTHANSVAFVISEFLALESGVA